MIYFLKERFGQKCFKIPLDAWIYLPQSLRRQKGARGVHLLLSPGQRRLHERTAAHQASI